MRQLDGLVDSGNTVIVIEHDMRRRCRQRLVIDIGPGAGDAGGVSLSRARRPKSPAVRRAGPRRIWRDPDFLLGAAVPS